ncbi:MAG: hypothetical protein U0798_02640 [Gemmataceae bacterium]
MMKPRQMEHFWSDISFSRTSADFGFLVPAIKPDISEVEEGIYGVLANVTKPRIEVHWVRKSNFRAFDRLQRDGQSGHLYGLECRSRARRRMSE